MIIRADARALPLRDWCVDCCVTSPPYFGLRDYGTARWIGGDPECQHVGEVMRTAPAGTEKQASNKGSVSVSSGNCLCGAERSDAQIGLEPTPDAFVASLVAVFREVRRVLKAEGTCWLNLGDSYAGGNQTGRNDNGRPEKDRGWAEYDITRTKVRRIDGAKQKDLLGIPWMVAFALRADGWYLRSDIIWSKPNPMPESVTDRPTKAHEYLFLLTKSERYWYDASAIREPYAESTLTQFEKPYEGLGIKDYAAVGVQNPSDIKRRITDKQRGHGRRHAGFNDRWDAMPKVEQQMTGANKRSVWNIATMPYAGAHFATMPEKLVEPCILAGCPAGGLVLDPFLGSGTVGAVAARLGRRWVGTDLSYQALAQKRTAQRGLMFTQESA